MQKKFEIITPRIHITAKTLHLISTEDGYLVVAVSDIAYTAHIKNDIVTKMLSSRENGNTYVIDALTPIACHLSKLIIRAARILIEINQDTDILFY